MNMSTVQTGPAAGLPAPASVYAAFEAFPRPKGASSHIAAMVSALAVNYAPVWLLCCGFADMPPLQLEGDIVIFRHKMHHPNLLRRAAGYGDFIFEHLAGAGVRPRLAVFRDPWSGWPLLSALGGVPAIFEVNGLPSWELGYNHPAVRHNTALTAKIEDVERLCLQGVDRLITVSEVTGRALTELGADPERIHVAPNSADDVFFQPPSDSPLPEVLKEGRWFGYFGSLHPWQGVDLLIQAWARLASLWPDVRLMIVHSGRRAPLKPLRKRIRKLGLELRVYLQSPLPPDELAGVLPRFEFTTAPLTETYRNIRQGCCPVKIVESMAAGVPVLASDLTVNRALVVHGRDGWLVRPGDVRAWAWGINRLLEDAPLRAALAAGARETAGRRFTRQIMFDKLDQVFGRAARPPDAAVNDSQIDLNDPL